MRTIARGSIGGLMLVLVAALAANAQDARLDKIIDAALHGPELRKVKFVKHEFHIQQVKVIDRVTGITRIEGQITHYLLFRPDDQFYYTIEKRNGKIIKFEFQIDQGKLAPYVSKLSEQMPVVGVAAQDLAAVLRRVGQKLDGTWEAEAEFIAFAIALRVDPMSHRDLVSMLKEGKNAEPQGDRVAGALAAKK